MVKVTLEFLSVDQAIVALGKLVVAPVKATQPVPPQASTDKAEAPAPAATTTKRKGRSDKGQPRGPHGATKEAAPGAAPAEGDKPQPSGVTPSPAAASTVETPTGPAQTPKTEDVQKALEGVFNKHGAQVAMNLLARFGVKRLRDLKPEQGADFIAFAAEAEKTGQV